MWSPHIYKQKGLDNGLSDELLERAISQSEDVIEEHPNLPSILSLKHLSIRANVSHQKLSGFITRGEFSYEKFSIKKRSGGRRFIYIPESSLLHVQRWINEFILKPVPVHQASCAFSPGSSTKKCAAKHCGAKWLIKFDITDFFESISEIQVFRLFREFGYQPLVAFQLARICTIATSDMSPRKGSNNWKARGKNKSIPQYNQKLLGYLPQGAATSPIISNLVMRKLDSDFSKIARKYKLVYTRYSDDITFSTRVNMFDRESGKNLISEIYSKLNISGYKPQYRKTKIIPPSAKKIVLGLNVDGPEPRLQKEYKDRIRQHFYYIEKLGLSEHIVNRGFDTVWGFKCHLKGLIDYANSIEPEYARKLTVRFNAIDWPV
ncbi:reverse transcriptase family protein [Vibrio sp. 10N.222.49.B4]|uniref:reverse transcriptase family protein n=1 Tax=Vibrio sp. 10N.222.49.B4 TaxID=3229613 RepID=UPI0035525DA8